MNSPGEDLPKVSHYYTESHPFYRKRVAVVGGKNSAVEAALELYKAGADVTLIHRGPDFGESVKYWILPDIRNRINEGKITALFNTVVTEVRSESITIENASGGRSELANDFVFALTGDNPDMAFLTILVVGVAGRHPPVPDPRHLEP